MWLENIPHALQIVRPFSSLLHSGVIVVLQFWQAMITVETWVCKFVMSMGAAGSSEPDRPDASPDAAALAKPQPVCSGGTEPEPSPCTTLMLALLDIRLL